MRACQRKICTPRIRNQTPIRTRQGMSISQHIIHMSRRSGIIRAAIKRDNPSLTPIRIAAIRRTVSDIVHPIADILIVAGQSISKVDVEGLGRTVAPGLVIRHAGPADIHHAAVAGGGVGGAPGVATETVFKVDVGLVVDTVKAFGAIVPVEGGDFPGREGAAIRRGNGAGVQQSGGGGGEGHEGGESGGQHSVWRAVARAGVGIRIARRSEEACLYRLASGVHGWEAFCGQGRILKRVVEV